MPQHHPQPPIGDYAAIGDCRTAALISRDGSLDWLCLPRFDSPFVFGALLDQERGGRFAVRPAGVFETRRRYLGATNVLETTFRTSSGELRLVDFIPVADEEVKRCELRPDFTVARSLECLAGEVEVEFVVDARPDSGRASTRITNGGRLGFAIEYGSHALTLRSEIALRRMSEATTVLRGVERLRAGEHRRLALAFSEGAPAILPPLGSALDDWRAETLSWWGAWAGKLRYVGPHREAVERSALALKLLCFAPSGAVVAAPTTSLPEVIGADRNWDYRYCWLRDASLTTSALFALGYHAEAEAFLAWMLHSTRLTWPELQVLYTVFGEARVPEQILPQLSGYAGSRPVRVGNGAHGQLQLDVYGEVVNAAFDFVQRGGSLDASSARMLAGLGQSVSRRWHEPDAGIWEGRSGPRRHTLSIAMCGVALERLAQLGAAGHLRLPPGDYAAEREQIRRMVETEGYSARLGSYVAVLGSEELDASLLLLGLHGWADPRSPRMRGTYWRIRKELGVGPLLFRNRSGRDDVPAEEGSFGICSFWGVEQRARQGDLTGAEDDFKVLLGYANDLGLYAEEMQPTTGAALGNFPQAFTHVGLIRAALALAAPHTLPAHITDQGTKVPA